MRLNQRGITSNPDQFGSIPNNQAFYANQPLLIAAVRQLIEESHLDLLVNLLTSHLMTVLNPIIADTNAKYEHLANRYDSIVGGDDGENSNAFVPNDEVLHETFEADNNLENNEIPIPE
ncbi:hypothetical protein PIB30_000152 [Stylosanthes scabra]|uniref:Uncharacterized protein n=1 Tax=Stylosanthes scabra TaxID=79078 RepID=A0ABU6R2A2_9FABA|nr:hypothetical protein [Stylosanthes scabra]